VSHFFKTAYDGAPNVAAMTEPGKYGKTAQATLGMSGWEETIKVDIDPGEGSERNGVYYPKRGFTRAEAEFAYHGDIEGTSVATLLITYKEGEAPVFSVERFTGSIGGVEGSCVFTSTGTQSPSAVVLHYSVVPGMGTGGLAGLSGEMDVRLEGSPEGGYPLELHYDLD
jgi:hypothetical protein